ncbi:MAG: type II toxin-antitoxin system RelE/ParE family toxin [Deltaproteobacteria bacterium]|nr:type II toxin-antitoxin system RelE/ParE family toxin [Deltaproteobacteria bacterium]MBW2594414.1 type II toxin-antitoxin system RelE/ParE family toxin [Deltaproteobacteria bacterium]
MKIIWTQEALEQLIEIEDYISKDSGDRAERFVNQLIEHAELLPENPRLGRTVPEIANPTIRELIFKKYRIVYRLNEDSVEILTVFEGHMLLRIDETKV